MGMNVLGVSGRVSRRLLLAPGVMAAAALAFGVSPAGAAGTAQTVRVSVSSSGSQGDSYSSEPSISADGRFVAFTSNAGNLVPADTNDSRDVFVYNRATQRTRRVSVSSTGAQADAWSYAPSISADGRFVAFQSYASNLVAGDTNGMEDVFVFDRATQQTRRVSVSSKGTQGDADSYDASVSGDGRFVAFQSDASNLVRADTNGVKDVFVYDLTTGRTRRVSVSSTGTQGDADSLNASVSGDGRFVAFQSDASNLVRGDTNHRSDVFVYDRTTQRTRRASVSSTGVQVHRPSQMPSISADGRFVAFTSVAAHLVRGDTNHRSDVFVHDRTTQRTRRVSVSSTGGQANQGSYQPSISARGRFVAFESLASNLVRGDNGLEDVFVYDRSTHRIRRVSVSSAGTRANGRSFSPSISPHGRFVAFGSYASNLVEADTNGSLDVFVRGPLS